MKRIFFLVATLGIELFAFQRWFGCWLFQVDFYFTPQTLTAQLIDAQNADKGMPLFLVRALHNKILALGWGLMQTALQYWDIRFLAVFIGLVGAVGVGLGLWYLFTKDRKNIFIWGIFLLGIIFSLIEMFFQPHITYAWVLYAFGILYMAMSLYGMWKFLKEDNVRRYFFIAIVLIISLLSLSLFPLAYLNFCLKI